MKEILNKAELDSVIENNQWVLIYLSRPECGVCKSLLPKINSLSKKYPKLKLFYVNLNLDPEIQGQYSIYTIPGILSFVDGKESIREARYISISEIDNKLNRISSLLS